MDQLRIFWIITDFPIFYQSIELRLSVDFNECINGIACLVNHIVFTAIQVIVHARSEVNTDRRQQLQHIKPVRRHRPTPAIAVVRVRNHIAQVVHQYAGKPLADAQAGNLRELNRPIIPELKLHTVPVGAGFTVALPGFVINTNDDLAFGASDHHRGALTGEHQSERETKFCS